MDGELIDNLIVTIMPVEVKAVAETIFFTIR